MNLSSFFRKLISSSGTWFTVILVVLCAWVLSLPVFPSQDGPMHRYYIHVLDSLLRHQSTYRDYQIRHPFPPYATHYLSLVMLSRVLPMNLAEKLLVCAIICCLALGIRASARQIGPMGEWMSLLFAPLVLSWPLMMGFFNFTLGVALAILATAFWQKVRYNSVRGFLSFGLVVLVLTFTHPIPLLLLILICGLDLVLSFLFRPQADTPGGWFDARRLQLLALLLVVMAATFPALAVDKSKTQTTLELVGFHANFLRTSLLLSGISPYNSRSLTVPVDFYRLTLYVTYVLAMLLGARAAWRSLRERRVNFGTTIFLATLTLTLVLPFTPNQVNGSDYFATRLVFVLWPCALLGSAAAMAPSLKQRRAAIAAGLVFLVAALAPAQTYIRPLADDLSAVQKEDLKTRGVGSLLLDPDMLEYTRFERQTVFNPLEWGGALAFARGNGVILDSPWIDQRITPIAPAPGAPLLVEDIALTAKSKTNPPAVVGRSLPASREADIIRNSSVLLYAGTPGALAQGLSGQLSPEEAAQFTCGPVRKWYRVCERTSSAPVP